MVQAARKFPAHPLTQRLLSLDAAAGHLPSAFIVEQFDALDPDILHKQQKDRRKFVNCIVALYQAKMKPLAHAFDASDYRSNRVLPANLYMVARDLCPAGASANEALENLVFRIRRWKALVAVGLSQRPSRSPERVPWCSRGTD